MDFKELIAYRKAFSLAMEIFQVSKTFPKEETYSLTDQIRRSSRSVCANIAEAYRKRIYQKHYISKLTDSDAENSETVVWLDFALACNYISKTEYEQFYNEAIEIGKLINYMITNPEKFGSKPNSEN
ncbi:MAG: four helix bundle protein [Bacteroidetes bacterium GWF2_42_66]|nr:MAG: four helix bundle protein [Bacteroidetes bacterium GWA2_42_15]OFY02170.1 MAG: four helix bundle protein [Bacteroidetes bacterium GWE2_42_39]OFY43617.1 MAG: four helix bundle protein [Bacteroidetes bacterium GWF2_42_66]HBL75250.1 diversity-generating retroelement protein bAvd family protein [Prolixibacteraceae bacterium]HCR92302.1 diversity-generating retroelement protein bAvd family protein [Prolixibacteraceae bacterium]